MTKRNPIAKAFASKEVKRHQIHSDKRRKARDLEHKRAVRDIS